MPDRFSAEEVKVESRVAQPNYSPCKRLEASSISPMKRQISDGHGVSKPSGDTHSMDRSSMSKPTSFANAMPEVDFYRPEPIMSSQFSQRRVADESPTPASALTRPSYTALARPELSPYKRDTKI